MNLALPSLALLALLHSAPASADGICLQGICVGNSVIETYNQRWARVGAINFSRGTFALVDPKTKEEMGSWERVNLAVTKPGSCLHEICVGDKVVETYNQREAYVAGINFMRGTYELASRTNRSELLGGWELVNLARTVPGLCLNGFCVGDRVTETYNQRPALIIGLNQSRGCFFLANAPEGGELMGCWEKVNLALKERGKDAAERALREKEEKEAIDLSNQGMIEIAVYRQSRKGGRSHAQAIEDSMGPVFISLDQSEKFLARLSGHVYAFDATYIQAAAKLLAPGANLERSRAFVISALLPFLRAFGYPSVKERYINPSVTRIEAALAQKNIRALKDMESTPVTKKLAVFLLAASLQTEMPQLSEEQKPRAQAILSVLGDVATKSENFGFKDMEPLLKVIPEFRALLTEIAQNLYFTGRAATDMQILDYLENQ